MSPKVGCLPYAVVKQLSKPLINLGKMDVNPLRTTVIQKLLEIIGIVSLCPSCSFATALDSDINQTTGTGRLLSMWENRWMHAAVCLLRAGQPRSAGDAAKSGQFIGQFSWVTGDPIVLKGLSWWWWWWRYVAPIFPWVDNYLKVTSRDKYLVSLPAYKPTIIRWRMISGWRH